MFPWDLEKRMTEDVMWEKLIFAHPSRAFQGRESG